MAKLVIIESPGKIKTISKYLGRGYEVVSSMGHLRDLPKSTLGVDLENNFEPRYIPIRGKDKQIKELKKRVKSASEVILAGDPDREGEAISWHLAHLLGLDLNEKIRVTFNEITKKAVLAGMHSPRTIDIDLVDAYQARRVLDRIVGYKLSPLLWKKVRRGLSAGRVQSVVTRLVVDREREIRDFVPEEYWNLDLTVAPDDRPEEVFVAHYHGDLETGKKLSVPDKETADAILDSVKNATPLLQKIKKGTRQRQPAPPFITSTLQQDASRRFSFSSRKTMKLAQDLYEGVNVTGHGAVGLITYMRTDSLRLSADIVGEARTYIDDRFGAEYLPEEPRQYRGKNAAQDAHEAIRPTNVSITPDSVKNDLSPDHWKLYKLIWERFIACQMKPAVYDTVSLDIDAGGHLFRATGRTLKFAGFTALYEESTEVVTEENKEASLPRLEEGQKLINKGIVGEQKFTQPPPRYTEASLIQAMEEKNIGRPSTYAPTISTILEREYVEKEGRSLKATPLGEIVTDLMKDKFVDIIDVTFTARMEEQLDKIAEGEMEWRNIVGEFYRDFARDLEQAEIDLAEVTLKAPDTVTDVICELCGTNMIVKSGRFGKFLACPNYPECKNTKPMAQNTPGICPRCGGKVLERKSKKGNKYYACENLKNCEFITWDKPLEEPCPQCGKPLFRRYTREEKKIYCVFESCGYEREYKPRGRAKQTESGVPDEQERA